MRGKIFKKLLLLGLSVTCISAMAPVTVEARQYYSNEFAKGIPSWVDASTILPDTSGHDSINQYQTCNETVYSSPYTVFYLDDDLKVNSGITVPACTPLQVVGKYTNMGNAQFYVVALNGALYYVNGYYGILPKNLGFQTYPTEEVNMLKDAIKKCQNDGSSDFLKAASDMQAALNALDAELSPAKQSYKLNLYLQICEQIKAAYDSSADKNKITYTTPALSTEKTYFLDFPDIIQSDYDIAGAAVNAFAAYQFGNSNASIDNTTIQTYSNIIKVYVKYIGKDKNGKTEFGLRKTSVNGGAYTQSTYSYYIGELKQATYSIGF